MKRSTFLSLSSSVALAVGAAAILAPGAFLASKGVVDDAGAVVWMRETGVLIFASGVVARLVREHPASPTLRAVLLGNALVQAALFPIEIAAYAGGVITKLGGIVPNSVLHVVLAAAFVHYARDMGGDLRASGDRTAAAP